MKSTFIALLIFKINRYMTHILPQNINLNELEEK